MTECPACLEIAAEVLAGFGLPEPRFVGGHLVVEGRQTQPKFEQEIAPAIAQRICHQLRVVAHVDGVDTTYRLTPPRPLH